MAPQHATTLAETVAPAGARYRDLPTEVLAAVPAPRPAHWSEVRRTVELIDADGEWTLLLTPRPDQASRWPFEATTLATAVARTTRRLRLVIPVDDERVAPYHLARYLTTLAYAAGDRLVLGARRPADEAERRRRDEHLAVVRALWGSWTQDAILADRASGRFFDPSLVRDIDFVGEHFEVKGALNLPAPRTPFPEVVPLPPSPAATAPAAPTREDLR